MRIPKLLLAVSAAVLVGFGIFQISLSKYKEVAILPGCDAKTLTGLMDPTDTVAFWDNQTITPLSTLATTLSDKEKQVLGTSTDEKWIEVDLGKQKIIAHQGDQIFLESLVSSGLWNKTPVGEYRIWYKIVSTKMEGGIKGQRSYYYLPNVPYAMFFKGSYGIHGTYWHNNFGTPRSHGCVNTPTNIAERIFYWSDPQLPEGARSVRASDENPGTRVVVHD